MTEAEQESTFQNVKIQGQEDNRKYSFSTTSIDSWNQLPEDLVCDG